MTRLKRTCLGCYVCEQSLPRGNGLVMNSCRAGYKTEKIEMVCGFYGNGKTLIGCTCRPLEPCPKPKTTKQEIEVMRNFYDSIKNNT